MLQDTRLTRRHAAETDLIADITGHARDYGVDLDAAVSAALAAESEEHGDFLRGLLVSWRMVETGMARPVREEDRGETLERVFRFVFIADGRPRESLAKAVLGPGDFGEDVLTFCLPEESFAFTGQVLRIRAEYVLHLSRFLARSGSYQSDLSCIHVAPNPGGGAFVSAMDGHTLGVFLDRGAFCREPVSFEPPADLLRHCKGTGSRYVYLDSGRASVEDERGGTFYVSPASVDRDVTPPDWRPILERAVERSGPGVLPAFNPEGLGRFAFQGAPLTAVRFFPGDTPESPVVVRHAAFPDFVGLLMPVSLNGSSRMMESAVPPWFPAAFEAPDRFQGLLEKALAA